MDTRTGEMTSKPEDIDKRYRLKLTEAESNELRLKTVEQRVNWFRERRHELSRAGRLPHQQGRPKWSKNGRTRQRRTAQRNAAKGTR